MTRSLVDTKNVEGYSLCLDTRLLHIIVSDSDSGEAQLARYIELINREDLDADDQFDA